MPQRPLPPFLSGSQGYNSYQKIVETISTTKTFDDKEIFGALKYLADKKARESSKNALESLTTSWCNGRTQKASTGASKKKVPVRAFGFKDIENRAKANPFLRLLVNLQIVVSFHDTMTTAVEKRLERVENSEFWADQDGDRQEMWESRRSQLEELDYSDAEHLLNVVEDCVTKHPEGALEGVKSALESVAFEDQFVLEK